MPDSDTLIRTIPKNAREELRVMLRSFRGRWMLDLRVFAKVEAGEPVATAKGIAVRLDLLGDAIDAMQAGEAEARKRGLLT